MRCSARCRNPFASIGSCFWPRASCSSFWVCLPSRCRSSPPSPSTIIIGWLFLISGVAGLITTFGARHAPGFWWSLLSAVLGIAAGVVLLVWPVSGVVSLTLLLIVFFTIEGVLSIFYALEHKRELTGQWGWMLVSGIIDLVLAAMIWAGLPSTAAWALGLLVGINLLFGGSSMVAMALHARSSDAVSAEERVSPPRQVGKLLR